MANKKPVAPVSTKVTYRTLSAGSINSTGIVGNVADGVRLFNDEALREARIAKREAIREESKAYFLAELKL